MTPHINASKDEIAKIVIMPGDPLRAKKIAETYLDDYKLVNEVRGMLAYTGLYKNKKVTIMASGMGMPSMGIYSYELFNDYDVDIIIRVGSAGAYVKELNIYDVVLVNKSVSESTYAKVQNGFLDNSLSGNEMVNNLILSIAREKQIPIHFSNVECGDVFYKENNDYSHFVKNKIVACEMESFALFHNANVLNKKAACLLTVSNNWETGKETTSEERQNAFMQMVELALETALRVDNE